VIGLRRSHMRPWPYTFDTLAGSRSRFHTLGLSRRSFFFSVWLCLSLSFTFFFSAHTFYVRCAFAFLCLYVLHLPRCDPVLTSFPFFISPFPPHGHFVTLPFLSLSPLFPLMPLFTSFWLPVDSFLCVVFTRLRHTWSLHQCFFPVIFFGRLSSAPPGHPFFFLLCPSVRITQSFEACDPLHYSPQPAPPRVGPAELPLRSPLPPAPPPLYHPSCPFLFVLLSDRRLKHPPVLSFLSPPLPLQNSTFLCNLDRILG